MKKILVFFTLFLLMGGCAPTAVTSAYDIYSYHPFIYGEDGVTSFPPSNIERGESWVLYLGTVKRVYRPKRKYEYKTTVIVSGKDNYERPYHITGKTEIRNGTRCYLLRKNEEGRYKDYLIVGGTLYHL